MGPLIRGFLLRKASGIGHTSVDRQVDAALDSLQNLRKVIVESGDELQGEGLRWALTLGEMIDELNEYKKLRREMK